MLSLEDIALAARRQWAYVGSQINEQHVTEILEAMAVARENHEKRSWRYGRLEAGVEEEMERHRAFPKRRQTKRLADPQKGMSNVYVLFVPAWANAWPHLNDWFDPEAFFIGRGRDRPAIA